MGQGIGTDPIQEISEGVWALRIPMPHHPLRSSFCYAYVGGDGTAVVIDPGWPTEASWGELEMALRRIGASPGRVQSILLTHAHRDHSGLAGRLAQRSGASVFLHPNDQVLLGPRGAHHRSLVKSWLAHVGAELRHGEEATALGSGLPALPEELRIGAFLADRQVLSVPGGQLIVHETPGHTPGHVCFEDAQRGILFSGDHLLPRITPNISTMVGHRTTALTDYLESLTKVAALPVSRVMPGHEYSFENVQERVMQLLTHHRERLDEILGVLRQHGRATTYEVARELGWSRPWSQIVGLQARAALGEILAHLHLLLVAGAVMRGREDAPIVWSAPNEEALEEFWERRGYRMPV